MGSRGGFSLIEVLIAVVVLAIGALAAVTLQRQSTIADVGAAKREAAANLARQLAEAVDSLKYPDDTTGFTGCFNTGGTYQAPCAALSPPNPLTAQGTNAVGAPYTRTWRITRVNDSADADVQKYMTVEIRVSWRHQGTNQQLELATVKGWRE